MDAFRTLEPATPSVREAREFIAITLGSWGCPELVDVAILLTSELVTNAIIHAESRVELAVRHRGNRLRVEVRDTGRGRPVSVLAGATDSGGRGLGIVEAMAADWGISTQDGGKSVWFELEIAAERPTVIPAVPPLRGPITVRVT